MEILVRMIVDWIRGKRFGKYRGIVVSNADEASRGRLKVRIPSLGNVEKWALPCVPYAGPGVGFVALPPEDSLVWVEFEMGDPTHGQLIWSGCFWADGEAPEDARPEIKIWKTAAHTIKLDDGAREITIANSQDAVVKLAMEVTAESAGEAKLTVSPSGGVIAEQGTAHKLEVTVASVKLNNGALEVV